MNLNFDSENDTPNINWDPEWDALKLSLEEYLVGDDQEINIYNHVPLEVVSKLGKDKVVLLNDVEWFVDSWRIDDPENAGMLITDDQLKLLESPIEQVFCNLVNHFSAKIFYITNVEFFFKDPWAEDREFLSDFESGVKSDFPSLADYQYGGGLFHLEIDLDQILE